MAGQVRLIIVPEYGDEVLEEIVKQIGDTLPQGTSLVRLSPSKFTKKKSPRKALSELIGGSGAETIDLIGHYGANEGFRIGKPSDGLPYKAQDYFISDDTAQHKFFFDLRSADKINDKTKLRFIGCATGQSPKAYCHSATDGALMMVTLARKLCCEVWGTRNPVTSAHFEPGGELAKALVDDLWLADPCGGIPAACCGMQHDVLHDDPFEDIHNIQTTALFFPHEFARPAHVRPRRGRVNELDDESAALLFTCFEVDRKTEARGLLVAPERTFELVGREGAPKMTGRADVVMGGTMLRVEWRGEPPAMHALLPKEEAKLGQLLARVWRRPPQTDLPLSDTWTAPKPRKTVSRRRRTETRSKSRNSAGRARSKKPKSGVRARQAKSKKLR